MLGLDQTRVQELLQMEQVRANCHGTMLYLFGLRNHPTGTPSVVMERALGRYFQPDSQGNLIGFYDWEGLFHSALLLPERRILHLDHARLVETSLEECLNLLSCCGADPRIVAYSLK
jgi:hypothetical protein